MSKNDWLAGDTCTRSEMNQPYWLASGTVAAGGDASGVVRLFISPGIMRFPTVTQPVVSQNMQSVAFPAQGSKVYAIFMRSDGTVMVSGTDSIAALVNGMGPPRWDAEFLGTVATDASVTTSNNIHGPWNSVSLPVDPVEMRGQYNAVTTGRPRAVYADGDPPFPSIDTLNFGAGGSIDSSVSDVTIASGIGFLTMNDSGQMGDMQTILTATIRWMPSGALAGALRLSPAFVIQRADDVGGSTILGGTVDTHSFTHAQNPALVGSQSVFTTSLTAVNARGSTTKGFALVAYIEPNFTDTTAGDGHTGIRITGVSFIAMPTWRVAANVEPAIGS